MTPFQDISICYILSYRSPNYIRTITLLDAMSRIRGLSVLKAVNTNRGILRYGQTLRKLIAVRLKDHPDAYILGLRGYEIFWLVRLITRGKPLIFDHMMSPYDSIVNERRFCRKGGLLDRLFYIYEKAILRHADLILTDTPLHQSYFANLFHIPPDRICPVPVSTDESLFRRHNGDKARGPGPRPFKILFYGSFLPLHGIDIILEAAAALSDKQVSFTLIGGGRGMGRKLKKIGRLRNIGNIRHKEWVNYEDLPHWIEEADLCLGGPFGNTGQARRVITGKTFQFLAMGKPTVVGRIDGEFGFADKDNCLLVPQGNGPALAAAISWAMSHPEALPSIGRQGRALYENHYSIDRVKTSLQEILAHALSAPGGAG